MAFNFGAPKTTGGTSGFTGFSTVTTTTAPTSLLGATTSVPAAAAATSSAVTTLTTAVTSSASDATTGSMSFHALEELINKWRMEMEDQEKTFINQATQVNAWDKILISNADKINELNENVQKVKADQQKLDHELDFITSQQRELTEILTPLEQVLSQIQPNTQQHSSMHREHTYQLAENIDAQLKRMTEDLKEVIQHMNSNKNPRDEEPLTAVCSILNAHMDSLQWIDQNIMVVQNKLDDVSKNTDLIMETSKNRLK